jgi:hypothetical protein
MDEKEFFVVVFSAKNLDLILLIDSKVRVHTNHEDLKEILEGQMLSIE